MTRARSTWSASLSWWACLLTQNTIRRCADTSNQYRRGQMNKLCSRWGTNALVLVALGAALCCAVPARAGDSVPDWLRQLTHAPLPKYPDEADAVVLLDEETVT